MCNEQLADLQRLASRYANYYHLHSGWGSYLDVMVKHAKARGDTVLNMDVFDHELIAEALAEMECDGMEFGSAWAITYDSESLMMFFMNLTDAVLFRMRYTGQCQLM